MLQLIYFAINLPDTNALCIQYQITAIKKRGQKAPFLCNLSLKNKA